jgi:hypothetical protein
MPAIQHLLQRWGFVQLHRYGLELTSDGRILSTRPAVLDDGTGGRIVGWQEGDVSIWKLSRWSGTPPVGSEVASGVGGTPAAPPPGPPPAATRAIPARSAAEPPPAAAAPSRPSARVMRADVAGEPTVDEDDWEWTIALARARAAGEEIEVARPPTPAPRTEPPAPRPPERPTLRSLATADLAASGDWRKTDTTEAAAYEDYRVSTRPVVIPRATMPSTVIPVPTLPTVDATRRTRLEPVVRTAPSPAASNRFAKGTGPVDPPAPRRTRSAAVVVEDTLPNFSVGDHTRPGVAPATRRMAALPGGELDDTGQVAPPPSGDRTRPGIALPTAARAVELPSIKRRTAR